MRRATPPRRRDVTCKRPQNSTDRPSGRAAVVPPSTTSPRRAQRSTKAATWIIATSLVPARRAVYSGVQVVAEAVAAVAQVPGKAKRPARCSAPTPMGRHGLQVAAAREVAWEVPPPAVLPKEFPQDGF